MGAGLTGFVVSSALLGCIAGAYLAGRLADRWGRIRVMVLAAVLFTRQRRSGPGLAIGPVDLIVWRVVGGVGVGAASVIAPAYIAEISPAAVRGRLGSLQQLAIVTGIFVALLSDAMLAAIAGGAAEDLWFGLEAWRWMFLAEVVPAARLRLCCPCRSRSRRGTWSPRATSERPTSVLGQVLITGVRERIEEIRRTVRSGGQDVASPTCASPSGGLLPIVWIGIALSVFQQFVGINVIFYYSSTLWQSVGFTEADALTQTVITSVTNIVVTVVAISLIDKIGRRKLLLIGSAGMFLTLGILAAVFGTADLVENAQGVLEPVLGDTQGLIALRRRERLRGVLRRCPGGRRCGCSSARCSTTASAAPRWGWRLPRSGSRTSSSRRRSPPWPRSACPSPTASTPCSRFLSFLFVAKFVRETKGRQLEDMA